MILGGSWSSNSFKKQLAEELWSSKVISIRNPARQQLLGAAKDRNTRRLDPASRTSSRKPAFGKDQFNANQINSCIEIQVSLKVIQYLYNIELPKVCGTSLCINRPLRHQKQLSLSWIPMVPVYHSLTWHYCAFDLCYATTCAFQKLPLFGAAGLGGLRSLHCHNSVSKGRSTPKSASHMRSPKQQESSKMQTKNKLSSKSPLLITYPLTEACLMMVLYFSWLLGG